MAFFCSGAAVGHIGAEIVTFNDSEQGTAKKVSDHLPVRARFLADERFRDRK